jgi:hypothetical protein
MRPSIKSAVVIAIATAIALQLFAFGIGLPLNLRVLGDAYGYLAIADRLTTLTDVFTFAGDRTIGFPFFEFAVHKVVGLFTSSAHLQQWVDAICLALLIIHLIAAWFFARWAKNTNQLKSENAAHLLFLFLATCPVLIGHITTPITDTLAVDLLLLAVVATEYTFRANNKVKIAFFPVLAAFIFALAILVRPSNMHAVGAALLFVVGTSWLGIRRNAIRAGAIVVGCLLFLSPFYVSCKQKYGTICLQSPTTFNPVLSAQEGLKGARMLWAGLPWTPPGQLPVVPDPFMVENYYRQCHLTSIAGFSDTSLTGCLLSRPLTTPILVVKKWIGLFEYFRFTPYLETATPPALRWLSRAYGALAWIGFALSFLALFQWVRRNNLGSMKRALIDNPAPLLLICFSVVTLAQHTALHVEERYGFPLIPLCALMLVMFGETAVTKVRTSGWGSVLPLGLFCAVTLMISLAQVLVWDLIVIL